MELSDIRKTYYPEVEEELFWRIVRLDPTYNSEHPEKKGRYSSWLLALHRRECLRKEDYSDATEYLTAFEANKRRLEVRDINRYRSLPDLYDVVRPYLNERVINRNSIKRDEATKVYEDDEWTVIVPHTWAASKLYGAGTRWCTASILTDEWFRNYTSVGTLYININRITGKKYQMFVLRNGNLYRYCFDASDRQVLSGSIGLSSGAVDFYNGFLRFDPIQSPRIVMTYDLILSQNSIEYFGMFQKTGNSWRQVLKDNNFISFESVGKKMIRCKEAFWGECLVDIETFQLTPLIECDFCNEFNGDYAVAWKDGRIGIMDRQGSFHEGVGLLKECVTFSDGLAPVGLRLNVFNFVDEQGHLMFDNNFMWCGRFHDGYCMVVFDNGERGYISTDKREIRLPEALWTNDFYGDVAIVSMREGKNLVRKDGHFVLDKPVRDIDYIGSTGVCRIQLDNGRYTYCDQWSVFTDHQFLVCKDFVLGLAAVRTEDGTWNYLRTDGTLLLKRGVDWCTDFDREKRLGKIHTYRGDNYVNTDGELLHPWPKMKQKRHLKVMSE